MVPEGVYHWTATHPEWEGPVSAYAIDDGERLILVDPIDVPDDIRALSESRDVVPVLTCTWHERDAAALGFPVWAPEPDRPEDESSCRRRVTRSATRCSVWRRTPAAKASSTSCSGASGFAR